MSYIFGDDPIALLTKGRCQTGAFDGVTRLSRGLLTSSEVVPGKTDSGPQMSRNKLRRIREDNEILLIIQTFLDDVIGK